MSSSSYGDQTEHVARSLWPVLVAALFAVPFFFVAIPPLTDVPGHLGRFGVQTASAGDPMLRYFAFRWALTLNLASDGIVQMMHPFVDATTTIWLLSALTPVLTSLGIMSIARVVNPRGADALPWALLFVFNYPFLWGFLNFSLTAALCMLSFAGWIALATRYRLRSALSLVLVPLLLIGHGVAGLVGVGLVVAYTLGDKSAGAVDGQSTSLAVRWQNVRAPLAAALMTLLIWKLVGVPGGGATRWLLPRKGEALLMMLRDQNAILDITSVIVSAAVFVLGMIAGARLTRAAAASLGVVVVVFLATPSLISGSDRIDTRLAPLIPMLAFSMQDWSRVTRPGRRTVMLTGAVLVAVRLTITTASFAEYDHRYRRELSALDRVPDGARIMNLTRVDCPKTSWRSARLEHLANLATPLRHAWVNAHWSIEGLQLLQIRYRPSADYNRDPSQLIWPAPCIDFRRSFAGRERHTLLETMPHLPLGGVDYLWLIGAKLPATYPDHRLRRAWEDDISTLYQVSPRS